LGSKSEEQRDFSLDNGSIARWLRKDGCQSVVWVHQQIERIVQGCGVNESYQTLFEQIASSIDAPHDQLILGSTSQPSPTIQAFQAAMLDDSASLPNAGWHWESERALFPDDWTMGYDASDFCNYLCVPVVATPLEVEADFARNREHEPELWVSLNYMRTEHSDPYDGIFKANSFAQIIPSKNQEAAVLFIEELEDYSMFKLVWIEGEYTWNLYARIPNDQRAEQFLPIVQQVFQSALYKIKTR
jgi:hypothetical protein